MTSTTRSTSLRRCAFAALLLLIAGLAQAQYVWIDANGSRQFSDRPPPPGTPRAKILKAPGQEAMTEAPPASASPEAKPEAKPEPKKGPPTLADREQEYRKRQQALAQADSKAAEEARIKQAQRENCNAAREFKAQLDSGARIGTSTATGERGFLSDEARAQQAAKAQRVLQDCR